MLTIITTTKPFSGHNGIIQRNAIHSWLQLRPECEIILFGNEEGTAETAEELGIKHVPDMEYNEYGTTLLNSMFMTAREMAENKLL
ncbi:glycosyl transferase family 2, partial [Chloroflexota bacterium]